MADKDGKDDDLIMVGDGVDEGDQPKTVMVPDEGGEGEGEGSEEELGARPDDDTRVGGGEAEDDEKTAARRAERKTRRQRQKEARERDQRELRFLRNRNETVERQIGELTRRQDATETSGIDGRISQLESAIRSASDVYAKAIDANEGKDAAEAMEIRDNLRDQVNYLKQYKEQGATSLQEEEGPEPALVEQVRTWHGKNDWFDFGRRDEDSAIAGAIDDMLIRDGYDPTTVEYYNELDKRIARRLPHLAKKGKGNGSDDDLGDEHLDEHEEEVRKPGGPKFRVAGRERPLKSNEVHISRERREAMVEAGVWDDPKLRAKYLKQYATWDRENAE